MKYLLKTAFGLLLELTKDQADKALRFGVNNFAIETYGDAVNNQAIFTDTDRWIYEIDIFDETKPLD